MGLLKRFIRNDLADCTPATCRCRIIGERHGLAPDIRALLDEAEDLTRRNTGLTLVVAFNYGGRQEIVRAVQALAEKVKAGVLDPATHRHGDDRAACSTRAASRTPTSSSAPRASSGSRIF